MILDNQLPEYNYATVLVCDIHKEYPLSDPATILWDPDALETVCDSLNLEGVQNPIHRFADVMFKDRVEGFEDCASIWLIRGNLETIRDVFTRHATELMGGPQGADDDTFDYWPNAFDMLISMAKDLIILYREYDLDPNYMLTMVDRVIQSAIAINGPLEEWEADELPKALHELRQLDKERTS